MKKMRDKDYNNGKEKESKNMRTIKQQIVVRKKDF